MENDGEGAWPDQNIFLTSKTNFAVDNANQRFEGLEAKTLYKLLWGKRIKRLSNEGKLQLMDGEQRRGRPSYFTNQISVSDTQAINQYTKDAACNRPRHERDMFETFSAWDPTIEPKPAALEGELPQQCRFLYSLLQYCEWADREFGPGSAPSDCYFMGKVYVDEAQDLCPIEAIALAWFCVFNSYRLVGYGDPQQAMDQDRRYPKLWDVASEQREIFGEDGKRRVPIAIAELAEKVLPGLAPPASRWADARKQGEIVQLSCANSVRLPAMRGFNISESRWAVATSAKYAQSSFIALSPECVKPEERDRALVCATVFGVKGYEHPVVTIQRWKPKHIKAYLAGDLQTRRRLYVSLTRSEGTIIIHPDMLQMIEEGKNHVWT